MIITEALTAFVSAIRLKNYSKNTIAGYSFFLRRVLKALAKDGITQTDQITQEVIKDYLHERYYAVNGKGRHNMASTRNREISRLKSWLTYLWASGSCPINLGEEIEAIQEAKLRLPKDILTKRELIKLFSLPDTQTLTGYRDRMILEVLYATGMRREELCKLKPDQIDFEQKTVFIQNGKGQKDRVVPINDTSLKFITHYIQDIRPQLRIKKHPKRQDDELILSVRGKAVPANHLNDILNPYFKKAKLKKPVKIHSFRHTAATHLIQAGMPLRHLQEMLGHKKLDTTVLYLNLTIKDLHKEYRKYHPREREMR